MASNFHHLNLAKALKTKDLAANTLKIGLATSTYVPDPDDEFLDEAGADDFVDGELTVSGYTGGFAGAGRKTLASKTVTGNTANNRTVWDAADPATWTALGTGETIEWAAIFEEITDDTASIVYVSLDVNPGVPTNGGDFTINFHADGIMYIA